MFKPCVLIPVYNHEHAIGAVVDAVRATGLPCILVDDGSSLACAQVLDRIAAASPAQIMLVRHERNRGKGDAVVTGVQHAARAGFTHALQIDADGQHCTADIPRFIEQAAARPEALIVGYPQYDESVPAIRLYGRYLTHVWVWINTLSLQIKDSMCGFRVYPITPVLSLAQRHRICARMDFDTDILVRLFWDGLEVVNVGTRVGYPADGVSHFRLWLDNVLISRMHATLFFGMLLRAPKLIARKWSKP
jgi:glycosyltransferase involved in cell wall biosynthesis